MAEASAVPASAKGSWTSFIKSLASFNGDLASMTAPPFILSSTSLVEFSAYWAEHPKLFVAPAKEKTPEARALAVLKWFLSTLKQQYSSRSEKLGSEKKPLNPFLGELFLGTWQDAEVGETELISEQVSHHPPVTAYCIINKKHGVQLSGFNGQKASFSTTINVKQVGHATLRLDAFDEEYLITFPSLHIEGLVYGSPYIELNKSTIIQSSTGYIAKVDYSGKGWVSGKKNSFTATLAKNGSKDPLYTIEGQWTDSFTVKQHKKAVDSYHHKDHKTASLQLAPIDKQDPLESRRAWSRVAAAIARGNYEETGMEKSKIENAQRALRKKEKEDGTTWERRYFKSVFQDDKYAKLAEKAGIVDSHEKYNEHWLFDHDKYEKVKSGAMDEKIKSTAAQVESTVAAAPMDPNAKP